MRGYKRFGIIVGLTGAAVAGGSWLLGQATPPPVTPATQPSTTRGTTRPTTQVTMKFKDAPIDAVLEHLSEAAGFIIVKEVPVEGRVSVTSVSPISPEDAVEALNNALNANGLGVIQQGKQLRVVARATVKKKTPVFIGSDWEQIPDTDKQITQVIPLKNIDAVKLRQDLAPMIPIDADVTSNAGSNSIVITDVASNIRRLVNIIALMDTHEGKSSEMKLFQLKNASASTAAKLIMSVFQADATSTGGRGSSGGGGGFTFPGGGGFPGGPGGGGDSSGGRGSRGGGSAIDRAMKDGKINAASDDRTNTLIVTAPPDTLKLIEGIIKELDGDTTQRLKLEVVKLVNADATTTAKLITSIFSPTTPSSGRGGSQDDGGGYRPPRSDSSSTPGGGLEDALRGGKVTAVADDRTNSVIVTAPDTALAQILHMIVGLDKDPVSEQSFFIYPLRNGQAVKLETVLNTLFGNNSSNTNRNSSSSSRSGTSSRTSSSFGSNSGGGSSGSGSSGFGGTSSSGGTGSGRTRGTQTTGNGSVGGQFGGQNGLSNRNQGVVSELSGQVFVVADEDTNSLLVTVASRYMDPVKQIIAELDRPVAQVLIKVLVVEVTHDDSLDAGLDFSIINRRPNGQGNTITSAFGNATAAGGLAVSMLEDKLNVTLHALATSGKLDVLSRPYILASDHQEASITVGNEVPFITNTRITDTGQTINTIQYQDVGIILNVTPNINPDGLVIMDVAPEISQLTGTTVPISDNVSAPVIAKRSAFSRVGVRTGNTIVIGGLMEDRKTSTVSKIPLLGDIPFIGPALFSRTQVTKSKTELLIFLTPHVAQQPENLKSATEQENQGLRLVPKAVGPGKYEEHLEGLQRGEMPMTQPANPKEPSKGISIPPKARPSEVTPQQGVDPQQRGNQAPPEAAPDAAGGD